LKQLLFFCIAIIVATPVMAEDVTDVFTKCAITKDDRARLACYDSMRDGIVRANTPSQIHDKEAYISMSLADLKTDIKTLRNKKIAVKALIQTIGEMYMLKSDPMDMSPLFAETEKLPREDRKKLVSGCQVVVCSGVFYGTIKNLPLGVGMSVERVTWN
jgi:hypothetical protein